MPERSDERQREALLLAYQGEPMSTITARLGVTEAQVQKWLADIAAEARSAPLPAGPAQRGDRRELAQTLLDGGEFLSAGGPEEKDEVADVFIFFNDLAAHEFYDLVERSVDVVAAVEGVDRAWHADRELICVMGAVAPATLRDVLLRWWEEQLGAIIGRDRYGPARPLVLIRRRGRVQRTSASELSVSRASTGKVLASSE